MANSLNVLGSDTFYDAQCDQDNENDGVNNSTQDPSISDPDSNIETIMRSPASGNELEGSMQGLSIGQSSDEHSGNSSAMGTHSSPPNVLTNRPDKNSFAEDPQGLRVQLMPHQKYALAWSLRRETKKPSGGILADDMGLGKTLTMISLIMKSNEQTLRGRVDENKDSSKAIRGKTLVVCPASLLDHWENEINDKVDQGLLNVVVHHKLPREAQARRLADPDVVITSYDIVRIEDGQPHESPLFQIHWERIILDEAHQIKNSETQRANAVYLLKSRSRWALTGIPIHNKEEDLYVIMNFLWSSSFDDLAEWERLVHNRDEEGTKQLRKVIQKLMLRKTKQDLPEKRELMLFTSKENHIEVVTMDKEEQDEYVKLSKMLNALYLPEKAEKENSLNGIPVTPNAYKYSKVDGHQILLIILRLRQFCCHPALIKSKSDKEDVITTIIEGDDGLIDMMDRLTEMSISPTTGNVELDVDSVVSVLSRGNSLYADDRLNSKLREVMRKVDEIMKSEDKLIIVSQWVSLLDVVRHDIEARNINCVVLTGKVKDKERGAIVDKFNKKGLDPRIMLLSLKTGGADLNLVGANHLLLIDLPWNPQLESQSCNHIYRHGQEKKVHIYKFITSGTIEEKILKLQEEKMNVAYSTLNNEAGAHPSKISMDDLKTLIQP